MHSGGRVKVASHNCFEDCDPDRLEEEISIRELEGLGKFIEECVSEIQFGTIT
jgi:hypothetical protein